MCWSDKLMFAWIVLVGSGMPWIARFWVCSIVVERESGFVLIRFLKKCVSLPGLLLFFRSVYLVLRWLRRGCSLNVNFVRLAPSRTNLLCRNSDQKQQQCFREDDIFLWKLIKRNRFAFWYHLPSRPFSSIPPNFKLHASIDLLFWTCILFFPFSFFWLCIEFFFIMLKSGRERRIHQL